MDVSTWPRAACSIAPETSWRAASDAPPRTQQSATENSRGPPVLGGPPSSEQIASQHREHLRPDRDHADEQPQRRQRGNLFHGRIEHCVLLQNIEGTLFCFCSFVNTSQTARSCFFLRSRPLS